MLVMIVFAAACVYCAMSISKVKVNEDITAFLPANTDTRRGLTIMDEEFTTFASANVMLANTTYDRAKAVADEIAELPHVTGVTFDDSTAHFVSSAALLTVSFDGDETERFPTEYDALIEALAKSIVEISSSSLTTIAGLVALMLMQFRLGYDLGLVLSKSIVCSLITVFLLMPGLIAYCRKPLRKTAHRSHIPKLYGWGRFLMKTKLGFLVILPMAVCCSSRTEYAFSDSSIDELVHSESRGGALNELSYTRDGSRIVFTLENGGSVVLLSAQRGASLLLPVAAAAVVVIGAAAFFVVRKKKAAKNKAE